MKILLLALNAKYIHSNPAVYSLRACAARQGFSTELLEFTVNQREDEILRALYRERPDVLAVSVYIWNVLPVCRLLRNYRRICPETEIWLGGPEVSYESAALLERYDFADGIMRGEGEETFSELCAFWNGRGEELFRKEEKRDRRLEKIAGITWRSADGTLRETGEREPADLDELPFPYEKPEDFRNRIIYYESSRGCPFSCIYCLSSVERKLRFRSTERVCRELQVFLDARVPQVKFVDRTFNCRRDHTMAVWQYLLEHDNGYTNFHFEIGADLLEREELELLSRMRPGLVQLEIGVQSVNGRTLKEIRRTADFRKIADSVRAVSAGNNIHQHLDLIAGLPWENYESFRQSFAQVYALQPQQLQLGFLKVLRGTDMRYQAAEYDCVWKAEAPYEVLSTRWLSYGEVLKLKLVEEMVEVYYNSGQFCATIRELEKLFPDAFSMYEALGFFYEKKGYLELSHSRLRRYEILLEFIREQEGNERAFCSCMMYDLYARENLKSRPDWADDQKPWNDMLRRFYRREEKERRYLPGYPELDWKQLRSVTHAEVFPKGLPAVGQEGFCVLLFDYSCRDPLNGAARITDITQEVTTDEEEDGRNPGSAG
ncbi:MAG TPA: B12-binding domain-containing radical SAM protein [Candidatus Scatomonas merdavium]|nr:B12-binding domain-containing radical SAM protein [Candidatus Scatomonas merdavium]